MSTTVDVRRLKKLLQQSADSHSKPLPASRARAVCTSIEGSRHSEHTNFKYITRITSADQFIMCTDRPKQDTHDTRVAVASRRKSNDTREFVFVREILRLP